MRNAGYAQESTQREGGVPGGGGECTLHGIHSDQVLQVMPTGRWKELYRAAAQPPPSPQPSFPEPAPPTEEPLRSACSAGGPKIRWGWEDAPLAPGDHVVFMPRRVSTLRYEEHNWYYEMPESRRSQMNNTARLAGSPEPYPDYEKSPWTGVVLTPPGVRGPSLSALTVCATGRRQMTCASCAQRKNYDDHNYDCHGRLHSVYRCQDHQPLQRADTIGGGDTFRGWCRWQSHDAHMHGVNDFQSGVFVYINCTGEVALLSSPTSDPQLP